MQDFQLSKNFKLSEFLHPGDTAPPESAIQNLKKLGSRLQEIRDTFGVPIFITSGYRSPAHNATVKGSAGTSYHTKGMAADIQVTGMTPMQVYKALDKDWPGGLGIYPGHVHIDIRHYRVRWRVNKY